MMDKNFLLTKIFILIIAICLTQFFSVNSYGVDPDEILQDQKEESKKICLELIQIFSEIKGVKGIHLMGHKKEEVISMNRRLLGKEKSLNDPIKDEMFYALKNNGAYYNNQIIRVSKKKN